MQVIMRLSRDKGVVDDVDSINITTRVQRVTEGLVYHPASIAMPEVGTPHGPIPPMTNVMPKTYPLPPALLPSGEVYTYFYIPSLVIPSPQITQAEMNLGMLFTQSLHVQSSDDLKKQERKRVESMM